MGRFYYIIRICYGIWILNFFFFFGFTLPRRWFIRNIFENLKLFNLFNYLSGMKLIKIIINVFLYIFYFKIKKINYNIILKQIYFISPSFYLFNLSFRCLFFLVFIFSWNTSQTKFYFLFLFDKNSTRNYNWNIFIFILYFNFFN